MSVTRQHVIEDYFASEADADVDVLATLFCPDVQVTDEGKTIIGIEGIKTWKRAAKAKYHYTAQPLTYEENDVQSVVKVLLQGSFPGSPITVTYRFGLRDAKISTLEIA